MAEIQPCLTYDEQLSKLKERGCIIEDEPKCIEMLANVNYYRLSAYFLPFKKNGIYEQGISFERVCRIYNFDKELRTILFPLIETIEISTRARLAYYHAGKYGPLGYHDAGNFNNQHKHDKFEEKINAEIRSNENALFVKHHLNKYDGEFPLWAICELFTFGMLSYFYNDFKTADKKEFAGRHYREMVSWLRCCTDLRNICAHYGRIYYRIFPAMPAGFDITESEKKRFFGAMMAVKALYPFSEEWNNIVIPKIDQLIIEYSDAIDLRHIAFPENWKEILYR